MIWTSERNAAQGRLVADLYRKASLVPCDRKAVMVAGLPGADKASALTSARVDRSEFLLISIDVILEEMAVRELIQRIAGLSPLDGADLSHAEAQFIAKRLGLRALADGRNLLWDISMASRPPVDFWLTAMKSAGYSVHGIFVDISIEESVRRSEAAYRRDHKAYLSGTGYGGRYIPAEAIRALADVPGTPGEPPAETGAEDTSPSPDSTIADMISAFQSEELSLSQLAELFHARQWPIVPPACPSSIAAAASAVDDPQPYVPGSFDDVVRAYDLGRISDTDYELLAWVISSAPPGPTRPSQRVADAG